MCLLPRRTGAAESSAGGVLGVVSMLVRYPVKSMGGEVLAEVPVGPAGLYGDRGWAAYTADGGIGSGKTTRRFRRVDGLLALRARLPAAAFPDGVGMAPADQHPDGALPSVGFSGDAPVPVIEFPDGAVRADAPEADERLSAIIGRPLGLRAQTTIAHHDESPVHLITTAALRRLGRALGSPVDPLRFRANVVLDVPGDDFVEDAWQGRELALGADVVLRLGGPMPRCVMVGLPQQRLGRDNRILREIVRLRGNTFGLQAEVLRSGTLVQGDPVRLS